MKRFLLLSFVSIVYHLPAQAEETPEERALSIVRMLDKANEGYQSEISTTEITLINAHGEKITRKMSSKAKEVPNDGDKMVITFEWPADVKGTKMLTWTHKKGEDDQWLYLPSVKRTKRIAARNKTGSFMGSEFSYEDLGSQEIEKFTYKFVREGQEDSRDSWVIERYPTDQNSGYSKQIAILDKEYLGPTKVIYFDRRNEELKVSKFAGYKRFNKWWRPETIHVVNSQTKKESILLWKYRELGKQLQDSAFASENIQ